ncbi:CLN3 protein [Ancylostoma ceylanicum]|uniref:Battenin n=1 Tax=Ancylostoma ceylanicum TaxID=53326 RepID=A0A0D6LNL3_9BILA|nr:CLN3 protein [Ancylostoma ceylanicum]
MALSGANLIQTLSKGMSSFKKHEATQARKEAIARAIMTFATTKKSPDTRNMISFWIFGLCNNFTFSMMLSAAQDILSKQNRTSQFNHNVTDVCIPEITHRICSPTSAGVVLLCNIVPALMVKLFCPFVMHRVPYGIRHLVICTLQVTSLLMTAFSNSVPAALLGVCVASLAGGLGETTFLGLAGHYSKNTIATWSSGTGMAGLIGAFSYAGMTDARLLALSPTRAMLVMLVMPAIFAFTLPEKKGPPPDVDNSSVEFAAQTGIVDQLRTTKSLLRYMIPMFLVYLAEYLINQGLLELTVFDCVHGYGNSPASQYRWYQVMYQVGVFVSRSSLKFIQFNMTLIALMPLLQLLNLVFLTFNAIYAFVPHFGMVCAIILYEGLIGGGSYVNTFHHIHKKVDPSIREFALSTVSLADTLGILVAALTAIPLHNAICGMQWYS